MELGKSYFTKRSPLTFYFVAIQVKGLKIKKSDIPPWITKSSS